MIEMKFQEGIETGIRGKNRLHAMQIGSTRRMKYILDVISAEMTIKHSLTSLSLNNNHVIYIKRHSVLHLKVITKRSN